MKVEAEQRNHGSLQFDQRILISCEIPLLFDHADDSAIRGLDRLLELRRYERAANCKFDEARCCFILNG